MSVFFGKLIKEMREERMLTVEELAKLGGLSAANLADMENGNLRISIFLFVKLMRVLSSTAEDQPLDVCVSYAKDAEQIQSIDNNIKFSPLLNGGGKRHMSPFILQVYDKEWSDVNNDGGENFMYVLSGNIEMTYGDKVYKLSVGDSIYFDSTTQHSVKNLDSNYSKLLIVSY